MRFSPRTRLVAVLVYIAPCISQAAGNLSSQQVLSEVRAKGAKATVNRYWSVHSRWEALIRRIETGESDWLKVASALREGSDAGETEDLNSALGVALTRNPSGVLRLKNFEVVDVCQVPYLEASEKVVADFKAKAAAALARIEEPGLQERRNACQSSIAAH